MTVTTRKKLIEVALPLEAINTASAREKSIRHGHPSTLHLWWARRPLAAARAVIFSQMVDDPSEYVDTLRQEPKLRRKAESVLKAKKKLWDEAKQLHDKAAGTGVDVPEPGPEPTLDDILADQERQRLFRIIEDLVLWENTTNETVLNAAREEIWASWRRTCLDNVDHPRAAELFDRHKLPAFHDPFAGGGALPLEAQRLGLESHASDLNPVAVLINKAMIEIPPKFAGRPPVHPDARKDPGFIEREWRGAQGLAEDVRYYGQWMRDEAEKRIGQLYPKIEVTPEMAKERPDLAQYAGRSLTVIAWLWARTVKSPNPAFAQVDVPLASTFMLSTKAGKEAYVEPVIEACPDEGGNGGYRFTVKVGKPKDAAAAKSGTKLSRGANFQCLMSSAPIASEHIYGEANAGRMGARLMAIVAEGDRGRVYLAPTPEHEATARKAKPEWKPELAMPENPRWFSPPLYGLTTYGDLFTPRQLVALTTFSDLVGEAREHIRRDALGARASGPHPSTSPAGWHSRGYHPHFDEPGLVQSITFRLADSVPASLLEQWREELGVENIENGEDEEDMRVLGPRTLRQRLEKYEDAGHGACWLRDPGVASIVEDALLHFDGQRYRLIEWCIMPNHVHVLIETQRGHAMADVVRSWKTFTAREANRILGRQGTFWMPDYFDRFVRNEEHFATARRYIRENPVKAGLCAAAEEWRWGSAWEGREGERAGGPRTQDAAALAAHSTGSGQALKPLRDGGTGATAYADAVGVYLACGISRSADFWSNICIWANQPKNELVTHLFGRQAIPMAWDYAEANPFSGSGGNFAKNLSYVAMGIDYLAGAAPGYASQVDAATNQISAGKLISTDPPYYDNIGYADLSDYFYVWLRRSLKPVFPDLFATLAVPKAEELVATPYRHGSKEKAETFFLDGMTQAMHRLAEQSHPGFPVTIYYAFKQSESDETDGTTNTGWDTFLAAVIEAGFAVSGTWPMRTERQGRMIGNDTNSLASSIVLVCRKRPATATTATRREFVTALKEQLPEALAHLQRGNIAPVDLEQAAIGPGMAVYTRFRQVLDAEGKPLSVGEAYSLIIAAKDEALAEQEGDFDADTRWALAWFEQSGFAEGEYGVAETLSKAKNTSVKGLEDAGILKSSRGKVRLLAPKELPAAWDPATDPRLTAWEVVHHLIRALEAGGESAAAALVAKLGAKAEVARELAYRLHTLCVRKKRTAEALSYNGLVQSFPEIVRLAQEGGKPRTEQGGLFGESEE